MVIKWIIEGNKTIFDSKKGNKESYFTGVDTMYLERISHVFEATTPTLSVAHCPVECPQYSIN